MKIKKKDWIHAYAIFYLALDLSLNLNLALKQSMSKSKSMSKSLIAKDLPVKGVSLRPAPYTLRLSFFIKQSKLHAITTETTGLLSGKGFRRF
ncbi:MAG: hypothetical protein JW927_08100 [Deltaproteobacteria bacterium]|nr:hypothetical protein [Deltaproteobacteria bacterium]